MLRNRVSSYVLMLLAAIVCAGAVQAGERVDAPWKPADADTGLLDAFHAAAGSIGDAPMGISLDGDRAVIGVWQSHDQQGAAYVFVRRDGVWSLEAELTAPDAVEDGRFGSSVSLSRETAVIWSHGAAYVFVRSGGNWGLQQKLTASDGGARDDFGSSVSVAGDTAVVGAPNGNGLRGAALVFERRNGAWSQMQELSASDGMAGDRFGASTSVSGETLLIGAANRNGYRGAVYVFSRVAGVWGQKQELAASDGAPGDSFGISTALNGDTAVIGAAGKDTARGAAYRFRSSGGTWTQRQILTAVDGAANDRFGATVWLERNKTVIVAPHANGGRGAAHPFVAPAILGTTSLLVASGGGTSSVTVTCACAWTATSNSSFLHIPSGSASGTGDGLVVFTYDTFTGAGTQTGTLTIAGITVTVTQAGTNYTVTGGLVTLSGVNYAYGVAVDGSGNVYYTDSDAGAVREWHAATQQVTTVVSSGLTFPSGVAVDTSGNVYIADTDDQAVKEWNVATQQLTTLASGLYFPTGVAVDTSGNVYIAAGSILEWNAATQQVTTLVSAGLSEPQGVAVDGSGNVYIADSANGEVKEWNPATQQVTVLIAGFDGCEGVAVDGSGNVYMADLSDNWITKWNAATQQVTSLAGTGLGNSLYGVAWTVPGTSI